MAKLLKLRRGTTTQHGSFTGAEGEVTIDTTKDTAVIHDGSTQGGTPLAKENMDNVSSANIAARIGANAIDGSKISDGTITNAEVNASAAIAGTKVSPDFGSQTITTTGNLNTADITITDPSPSITFTDNDQNPDYKLVVNSGLLKIYDVTNTSDRFVVNTDGHIDVKGNLDCESGCDVTGNITVSGTVDGRDIATDGTKLDGIEASATADQTASEIVTLLAGNNVDVARLYSTNGIIGRDSTDYLEFTNNTQADIYINGNNEFRFEADGDFHADGDVIAQSTTISSDRRLKENIEVIPNALDKVQALNGVSFDWKKTGEKSAGVIAQEVQEVLPEAVKEVIPVKGGDSHLTVNYHALTSILIESIKELKAEIEELKGGE